MKTTTQILGSVLVTVACNLAPAAAPGAEIRNANAGPLEDGASWVGGFAPTASDIAVWDNAISNYYATVYGLTANASWSGIAIRDPQPLNPGASVEIDISSTGPLNPVNVLSLGAAGIDLSTATEDLHLFGVFNATANSHVRLVSPQIWTVGPERVLTMECTNDGPAALTKAGPGTLRLAYSNLNDDSHLADTRSEEHTSE